MGRSRQEPSRSTLSAAVLSSCVVVTSALCVACGGGGDAGGARTAEQIDAEIEALRSGFAQEPTTPDSVLGRAVTVRDWANRLASAGETLPYGLFADVSELIRAGGASSAEQTAQLDAHVFELDLRESEPDAIGEVRFEDNSPVEAGSWTTIEQTYVVGTRRLQEGARIVLLQQPTSDMGALQADDPTAANFVSIRSTSPEARFSPVDVELGSRAGEPKVAALGFGLEGGPLAAGQSMTVVYGRKSGGSPGLRAQTTSTDSWQLPILIDFDGSGRLVSPKLPSLRVMGSEPVGVLVMAPSIVGVGESFDLHVRTHDTWLNRASGDIPGYVVTLNDEDFSQVPSGSQSISVLRSLKLDAPGIYRFHLESQGEGPEIEATSHPIWVVEGPSSRVFWGETHVQTGVSRGQGSARHAIDFARDDARLDFVGLTESDLWLDDGSWRSLQQLIEQTSGDGDLVAYLGYERTVPRASGGHHAVLLRDPLVERVRPGEARGLLEFYAALRSSSSSTNELFVVAHADVTADWQTADADLLRFVEIGSQHGTFEWLGNRFAAEGHRVGFAGGSDDHLARPGLSHGLAIGPRLHGGSLTAVVAPQKTRDALWDALRARATYTTSGPRILLEATLNGQSMGSTQADTDERRVVGRVSGTSAIDHIDLIKNGLVIYSRDYADTDLSEDVWLQIGFESRSEILDARQGGPRPTRVWSGSLRVEDASIAEVRDATFDNPHRESLTLEYLSSEEESGVPSRRSNAEEQEPQIGQVDFRVETRGNLETVVLRLVGVASESRVFLELEPESELTSSRDPGSARELEGETIEVALDELADGRLERGLAAHGQTDRVTFQVIDAEATRDLDFEFVDVADPNSGDYYYIRVTQLDGAVAWTSPFWID